MAIKDGRGMNKVADRKRNTAKVKAFIEANEDVTIKECCEATGFTYKTVKRAINDIQAEQE